MPDINDKYFLSNAELLFIQWWTIELKRSLDDPHDKEKEAFMNGIKYALAYIVESKNA